MLLDLLGSIECGTGQDSWPDSAASSRTAHLAGSSRESWVRAMLLDLLGSIDCFQSVMAATMVRDGFPDIVFMFLRVRVLIVHSIVMVAF
jgi:hypothetical protein